MDTFKTFQSHYTIYYEDTDLSGHVYHANYIKFFERARTDYLLSRGLTLRAMREHGTQFVVSELNVKFVRPAALNDLIMIETKIIKLAGARLYFEQQAKLNSQLLCQGQVIVGCVDLSFKPIKIPQDIKKELM